MSNETYTTIDRLSSAAGARFGRVRGTTFLDLTMLLSAALSAIFFWQNSQSVFTDVWAPVALLMGLLVGLVPAEGAFFGWKHIRASKVDMTADQLTATKWGIVASVACALFSTFSLYIVSFEYVPAEIKAFDTWFIFLALSMPILCQVAIYAWFTTSERAVVENHEKAKLSSMGFDAYIKAEQARLMAIIGGMEAELNRQLETYGADVGKSEAGNFLRDGSQQLLNMGQNRPETAVSPAPSSDAQQVQTAVYRLQKWDRFGQKWQPVATGSMEQLMEIAEHLTVGWQIIDAAGAVAIEGVRDGNHTEILRPVANGADPDFLAE